MGRQQHPGLSSPSTAEQGGCAHGQETGDVKVVSPAATSPDIHPMNPQHQHQQQHCIRRFSDPSPVRRIYPGGAKAQGSAASSGSKRRASMGKWSEEEDEVLRRAVKEHGGKNWKKIAQRLGGGRTDVQCLHRWQKVLRPGLVKGPWTPEEDETVVRLVEIHGTKKWSHIARQLNGRLGKQCRERWYNHLDPNINKGEWTDDEDRILMGAHDELGNKWAGTSALSGVDPDGW